MGCAIIAKFNPRDSGIQGKSLDTPQYNNQPSLSEFWIFRSPSKAVFDGQQKTQATKVTKIQYCGVDV